MGLDAISNWFPPINALSFTSQMRRLSMNCVVYCCIISFVCDLCPVSHIQHTEVETEAGNSLLFFLLEQMIHVLGYGFVLDHHQMWTNSLKLLFVLSNRVQFSLFLLYRVVRCRSRPWMPHPWRSSRLSWVGPGQPELVGGNQPIAGGWDVLGFFLLWNFILLNLISHYHIVSERPPLPMLFLIVLVFSLVRLQGRQKLYLRYWSSPFCCNCGPGTQIHLFS